MAYSEFCREKFFPYKIEGQTRPFIDRNLQIQLPGVTSKEEKSKNYSPIYAYFSSTLTKQPSFAQTKEIELQKVMQEAELSYAAWKKMHEQILQAAKSYFSSSSKDS